MSLHCTVDHLRYGLNIVYTNASGPLPPPGQPINEVHWENASQYMADNFRPALVTNYTCAYGDPCAATQFKPLRHGPGAQYSCTVPVLRQNVALENAIGSHACSCKANMRVTNGIPLGSPLLLPLPP
jgi:hypothetical protein